MAVFPNAGFERFIVSVKRIATGAIVWFNEGFSGYGWKLWERTSGKHRVEIDEVFIRKNLISFEEQFSHLRSVNGELVLSQGFGKVKSIVSDDTYYIITLEGDMLFQPNDFIHYMNGSADYSRNYDVRVELVQKVAGISTLYILASEFENQDTPEIGDSLVQIGNATLVGRQSALIVRSVNGIPTVDVFKGVDSKDYESKIVHRFSEEGFIGVDRMYWVWNSGTQKFDINANFKTLNVDDSFTAGGNAVVGGNLTVGGNLITP